MPSPFEDEVAKQLVPELYGDTGFAVAGVTYTPPSGGSTSGLSVIVDESEVLLEFEGVNEIANRQAVLKVPVADLAAPIVEGRFVIGGDKWIVIKAPVRANGQWRCACEYDERESIGKKRD